MTYQLIATTNTYPVAKDDLHPKPIKFKSLAAAQRRLDSDAHWTKLERKLGYSVYGFIVKEA